MKLDLWKALILNCDELKQSERLDEIINYLSKRHNFEAIITNDKLDFLKKLNHEKNIAVVLVDYSYGSQGDFSKLILKIRSQNKFIPVIAFSYDEKLKNLSENSLKELTDFYFILSDTVPFLANRIIEHAQNYVNKVVPVFLKSLIEYNQENKYPWHTPGHMNGEAFRKDPTGRFFYDYLGENVFRSDLSISVPELGSLLDHSGPIGESEKNASKVFGSDQTYYVLNGTSSVNQIIWRSQVAKNDLALVDRNCHKSLNYAMVGSQAIPTYLIPRRNAFGIIGPVKLKSFTKSEIQKSLKNNPLIDEDRVNESIQMSALTNSTYDGLCYNVEKIEEELDQSVNNMHFDEAWFAYAKFHEIYKGHFAMNNDDKNVKHPPIFAGQSTHKLLSAFSQASMLHIKNGTNKKIDPEIFNETYMMYGSTSPQYNLIASLDVASKMMELDGEKLVGDSITSAINMRKDLARMYTNAVKNNDWFFEPWQPKEVVNEDNQKAKFEDVSTNYLAHNQSLWNLSKDNNWHGFEDIEDNYVMLDPIKVTIRTPGMSLSGEYEEQGIPASVVTNYLIDHGVVCEKTDYYSFLMLNSIGTTKSKQADLIIELTHFKDLYDHNAPMTEVFPELCKQYPGIYDNQGLKDHCQKMHEVIKELDLLGKMNRAFKVIPTPVMTPAQASQEVVKGNVKKVTIHDMMYTTAAVMVVPYPPGIPVLMGGEKVDKKSQPIITYLESREKFEQEFPGYYGDIHGIEPKVIDGKRQFTTMVIDNK